jgi:hypothetical protein
MNSTTTTTNSTTSSTSNGTGATLAPFQRNRYFYGKLMMVRDFLAEQVYMNGKRQLINRLVDGWGIVCGLEVSSQSASVSGPSGGGSGQSGSSLTVNPGVAIDCCGHEIIVDQQVPVTISSLLSNTAPTNTSPFDLCLSYSECLQEPVTALANASSCEETCEYNRIQETYQLSLRASTSTSRVANEAAFGKTQQTIYQDSNVLVQRLAPAYVNPGQVFAITLQATPASQNASFNVQLTITEKLSSGLKMIQGLNAGSQLQNTFTNLNPSVVYWVQAQAVGSQTVASVPPPSGGTNQAPSQPTTTIDVIAGSVSDQLVANYFATTLNNCPTCAQGDVIVLASFSVDPSFNVSNLTLPTQFVYENLLLYYLISGLVQQSGQIPLLSASDNGTLVQTGVTSLNFHTGFDVSAPSNGEADVALDPNLTVQSLTLSNVTGNAATYPTLVSSAANVAALENSSLGIGTSSPQALLSLRQDSSNQIGMRVDNAKGGGTIWFGDGGGNNLLAVGTDSTAINAEPFLWTGGQDLRIGVGVSAGSKELMRFQASTGNVGIGTTTPSQKLDVAGGIGIGNNNNNQGSPYRLELASGDPNHYIYSTGTDGNSTYFGEYNGGGSTGWHFVDTNSNDSNKEILTVLAAGNVGIGTTAPVQKLSVRGNETSADGFGAAVGISNGAAGGADWYLRAGATGTSTPAGGFSIANDTNYCLIIENSGNVGIGTKTPSCLLEVSSPNATVAQMAMVSAGSDAAIALNNTAKDGREYWIDSGSGNAGVGAGNFAVWDNTAKSARLVVNSSGNVGIGTTTPGSLLELAESAAAAAGPILFIHNTAAIQSGGTGNIARITFGLDSGATASPGNAYIQGQEDGGGNYGTSLQFGTVASKEQVTERMRITSTGNVGIGTATPSQMLDVAGGIGIGNNNNNQGSPYRLELASGDPNHYIYSTGTNGNSTYFGEFNGGGSTGWHFVDTNSNDSNKEILTVLAAGNVGIGTTAPACLLEVSSPNATVAQMAMVSAGSDAAISLNNTAANGREYWIDSGSGNAGVGAGNFAVWDNTAKSARLVVNPDGNVGIGTTTPTQKLDVAGIAHASSFPTSSDRRFKTNIEPLTNVLNGIGQIHGVSFDWNELYQSLGRSTGRREIGVVAQEVEAVFPELVTTWGEDNYRAVDYGRLTVVLLEAVKELDAKLQSVSEKLRALEEAPAKSKKK